MVLMNEMVLMIEMELMKEMELLIEVKLKNEGGERFHASTFIANCAVGAWT